MDRNRRRMLAALAMAPLAALGAAGVRAAESACYNPSALPLSMRNRRRSIGFVEVSTDPAKHCGVCAFFKPSAGTCGTCDMLSGGPVTSRGYCNSFARKR